MWWLKAKLVIKKGFEKSSFGKSWSKSFSNSYNWPTLPSTANQTQNKSFLRPFFLKKHLGIMCWSFKVKGKTLLKQKTNIKLRTMHNAIRMQSYTTLRNVFHIKYSDSVFSVLKSGNWVLILIYFDIISEILQMFWSITTQIIWKNNSLSPNRMKSKKSSQKIIAVQRQC